MMTNAGEPVLVCPYNKAHSIVKSRMQFHLAKCRLQYPNSEKTVCPYNSTHIVAKVELEFHMQICESRIVLDSFLFDVGSSKCPVEDVPLNVPPEELAPCEENWDEDPIVSVLDGVKERVKEKNVLLNLIGAPKAERKAHRQQERLRYQRVTDLQDDDKKKNNENLKKNGESKKDEHFTKKTLPKDYSNEDDVNNNNDNDENNFEVVKHHKKGQGKKNKQNQRLQVLHPSQDTADNKLIENDEMIQLTKLNRYGRKENDENVRGRSPTPLERRRSLSLEINGSKQNSWDRPLNFGIRAHSKSRSPPFHPIDDSPSLPVSGRGRGLFLQKY